MVDTLSHFFVRMRMDPEVPAATVNDPVEISTMFSRVQQRGHIILPDGTTHEVTGAVTLQDAMRLSSNVYTHECRTSLETGVACGFSTLAIRAAQHKLGGVSHHYAIDPDQFSHHKGAAVALLEEHGLGEGCEVLPRPGHLALPELLARNITLDFAFIDGWHTFDYTLLDFFYIDKMMKAGGIMAIHDCTWPAVQKVIRFITTHRHYTIQPYPRVTVLRSAKRAWKSLLDKDSSMEFPVKRIPNLVFLRKDAIWEPRWDYYSSF